MVRVENAAACESWNSVARSGCDVRCCGSAPGLLMLWAALLTRKMRSSSETGWRSMNAPARGFTPLQVDLHAEGVGVHRITALSASVSAGLVYLVDN